MEKHYIHRPNSTPYTDYVVYNPKDEVVAMGTIKEISERLKKPRGTIMCLVTRPYEGYSVVTFKKNKFAYTVQGLGKRKVRYINAESMSQLPEEVRKPELSYRLSGIHKAASPLL